MKTIQKDIYEVKQKDVQGVLLNEKENKLWKTACIDFIFVNYV